MKKIFQPILNVIVAIFSVVRGVGKFSFKVIKILPWVLLILTVLSGFLFGSYVLYNSYEDPYKCFGGEIFKRKSIDSDVYEFVGGYCVDKSDELKPPVENLSD